MDAYPCGSRAKRPMSGEAHRHSSSLAPQAPDVPVAHASGRTARIPGRPARSERLAPDILFGAERSARTDGAWCAGKFQGSPTMNPRAETVAALEEKPETVSRRAEALAAVLEEGAASLIAFAETLTDAEWQTP